MKAIIEQIETCRECRFNLVHNGYNTDAFVSECAHHDLEARREIASSLDYEVIWMHPIPDWCPLPDIDGPDSNFTSGENKYIFRWSERRYPAMGYWGNLLPCPFCSGIHAKLWFRDMRDMPEEVADCLIVCGDCGAEGPKGDTEECAVQNWNKRIKPAPKGRYGRSIC